MTLKEAKDILKKEFAVIGLHKSTEPFEFDDSHWFVYEKPSVLESFRVLSKEGYYISISGHDYNMREKRLQKEYEENTKAPVSAENSIKGDLSGNESIEHCGEPIPGSSLIAVEGIKLKWKDNRNTSENPGLEESASQFNDALLDEQAKKIVELTMENERLKDQVAVLYARKENNEKYNLKQIKRLGKEISKLNSIIHDKNAVLADVAEELRLSKIREKNLTEIGQKYMKENEELKKELSDKVVDKIDAQALKSSEKDEVIADLGKELAAQKGLKDEISLKYIGVKRILKLRMDECEKLKKELEAFKESYKRRIKEDSEHFEHIQKIYNAGLQKWLIESEYLEKDKPFRFPQLPDFSEEEEKKLSKVTDETFDQFLQFVEIIIKSEK